MKRIRPKLKRLARRLLAGPPVLICVTWADDPAQPVTIGGETMTMGEFERRYPEAQRVVLDWEGGEDD